MTKRLEFMRASQPQGVELIAWIAQMETTAELGDIVNMTLGDWLTFKAIAGCNEFKLREKLVNTPNPTLEVVKRIANEHLVAKNTLKEFKKDPVVGAVKANQPKAANEQARRPSPFDEVIKGMRAEGLCLTCGEKQHTGQCPGKHATCPHCHRPGHALKACYRKRSEDKGAKPKTYAQAADRPTEAPNKVNLPNTSPTPRVEVSLSCSDHHTTGVVAIDALPDTGSPPTVVAKNVLDDNNIPYDTERKIQAFAVNDTPVDCSGSADLHITCPSTGRLVETTAMVTEALTDDLILGWKDVGKLGIKVASIKHQKHATPTHNRFELLADEGVSADKLAEGWQRDFGDVFDTSRLEPIKGAPMEIALTPGAQPPPLTLAARQIPIHMREAAEADIAKQIDRGVIKRVDEASLFCAPAFYVPKPRGGVRLVTDYSALNKNVIRPVHPFPSALDCIRQVRPDSKVFAVMDATSGYHQIELTEKASEMTTFLLPFGRFRYTRAPMGLASSGDVFCHRTDQVIDGVEGAVKLVDDILIQAPSLEVLDKRVRACLAKCRDIKLTLSPEKLKVGTRVRFAGHVISDAGTQPDEDTLKAIRVSPPNHGHRAEIVPRANRHAHRFPSGTCSYYIPIAPAHGQGSRIHLVATT